MKRFLAITLMALVLVSTVFTTGCSILSPTPKEYSKNGITLTLPSNFSEMSAKDSEGFDYALETRDAVMMALKEKFSDYEALGVSISDYTLSDYAQLLVEVNQLPESTPISTSDGLTSFTYEKEVDGKDFYYFAVVYKGSDAFWLVQFACETKNKDKKQSDFVEYAKSVVIE